MIATLWRNRRGASLLEFALFLPIFLGVAMAGVEIANLMLVHMRIQRLATMTADLVAQRGSSDKRLSELQMYDMLYAMDIAAQPLDMRTRGRIIVTAVTGEDANNDGTTEVNRTRWQRLMGGLVEAPILIGCWSTGTSATLGAGRTNGRLAPDEPLFHVQVSYRYEPVVPGSIVRMFDVPEIITRTAGFRGRGAVFQPILAVDGFTPKDNCNSANID